MASSPVAWLAVCIASCCASDATYAATGQQLFASCVACHGARAEGNAAVGAPAIAGQSAAYVTRQLQNFRNGLRGVHKDDAYGAQMRATAQGLLRDDKDVAAVARHVASLPKTNAGAGKYDARNGNNLYQGKCGACHGGKAEGNESLAAPRLAGLDAAYLKRQYRNFGKGVRGAHPEDRYGRQMALMATAIASERDLDDVVGYIQSAGVVR